MIMRYLVLNRTNLTTFLGFHEAKPYFSDNTNFVKMQQVSRAVTFGAEAEAIAFAQKICSDSEDVKIEDLAIGAIRLEDDADTHVDIRTLSRGGFRAYCAGLLHGVENFNDTIH